jgi:hypothetical protein
VQASHLHVLEAGFSCSLHYPAGREASVDLENILTFHLDTDSLFAGSLSAAAGDPSSRQEGIALVTDWHQLRSKGGAEVLRMQAALTRNLMNPFISGVYLITEAAVDLSTFPNSHKLHQHVIRETKDGLQLKKVFDFANEQLKGRLVILGK